MTGDEVDMTEVAMTIQNKKGKEKKPLYVIIAQEEKADSLKDSLKELGRPLGSFFEFKALCEIDDFVFFSIEEFPWNSHLKSIIDIVLSFGLAKEIDLAYINMIKPEKQKILKINTSVYLLKFILQGGLDFEKDILKIKTEKQNTAVISKEAMFANQVSAKETTAENS